MKFFIIQPILSEIELQLSEEKISVMLNNFVAWSAEEFAARFAEACPNSLARSAADLLPCLIMVTRWFRLFVV